MLSNLEQLLAVDGRNNFEDALISLVYVAIDHHDAEHDKVQRLGEGYIIAHVLPDNYSYDGSFAVQQNLSQPGRIWQPSHLWIYNKCFRHCRLLGKHPLLVPCR